MLLSYVLQIGYEDVTGSVCWSCTGVCCRCHDISVYFILNSAFALWEGMKGVVSDLFRLGGVRVKFGLTPECL